MHQNDAGPSPAARTAAKKAASSIPLASTSASSTLLAKPSTRTTSELVALARQVGLLPSPDLRPKAPPARLHESLCKTTSCCPSRADFPCFLAGSPSACVSRVNLTECYSQASRATALLEAAAVEIAKGEGAPSFSGSACLPSTLIPWARGGKSGDKDGSCEALPLGVILNMVHYLIADGRRVHAFMFAQVRKDISCAVLPGDASRLTPCPGTKTPTPAIIIV